jgi:hypothetical protein
MMTNTAHKSAGGRPTKWDKWEEIDHRVYKQRGVFFVCMMCKQHSFNINIMALKYGHWVHKKCWDNNSGVGG